MNAEFYKLFYLKILKCFFEIIFLRHFITFAKSLFQPNCCKILNKIKKERKLCHEKKPLSHRFLADLKHLLLIFFFIAIPLFYIVTYLILGSKEALWQNQLAISVIWIIYALITSLFFVLKAQTPGYKAQNIYLINTRTGKKADFFRILLRFVCFIISGFCIIGLLLCFFRKDRLNLHDLLTQTAPVLPKS